ncbi:hypothetical protein [Treponema sp. J25]|uniref:hypothetical protein n=1 Tax=Treponema sp. J25 TaxID=2094121 RepID=UPI0010D11B89|nr:hypothetical protein [Treponema sp. J25]TCW62529.1 hypothetical protein C5O22_00280 [Treponema sp. J25]
MKGHFFFKRSDRGRVISRNILWTVGALCGIFVISCATIPSRPLPEKDPFDVLLNSLLALPPGGQFYMGARIADAAGLRTEIERTLPANESIRQGLKVTEQISMVLYAAGEGQSAWVALLEGRYPAWQINWSLWWHPAWKKRRSAEGIPFWYNAQEGLSLQTEEHTLLLSNAPEGIPFRELLNRVKPAGTSALSIGSQSPVPANAPSSYPMPDKKAFSFFSSRQKGRVILIGWLNEPFQTVAASLETLSVPLSVPIERVFWVLEEIPPEGTEKDSPYCLYLALQTPSVSHARALSALLRLSQRFAGTLPLPGGPGQDPLAQLLMSLLSTGNIQQEETSLVIESKPIPSQDIALLFSRLLVYSTSKKTIP